MRKQLLALLGISMLAAAFSIPLGAQGLGSPNVSPASGKPIGDDMYSSDRKKMHRAQAAVAKPAKGGDSTAIRPAASEDRAGDSDGSTTNAAKP